MNPQSQNTFLLQVQKGKFEGWRFLLFFGLLTSLFLLAFVGLPWLVDATYEENSINPDRRQPILDLAGEGLQFLIVLTGIAWGINRIHQRTFTTLLYTHQKPVGQFLEGLLVWGLLVLSGTLITKQGALTGSLTVSWLYSLPIAASAIFIQSFTEEVIFRGYLLQSASLVLKRTSFLVVIPSCVFGLLHLQNGLSDCLLASLFGCLLSLIVLERENLGFVSGVHFINNFIFGYVVESAGQPTSEPDFFALDPVDIALTCCQFGLLFVYVSYRQKLANRPV
ncbi:CPBP family intramembrane glutamic endopeptidase [Spirosoma litoris]